VTIIPASPNRTIVIPLSTAETAMAAPHTNLESSSADNAPAPLTEPWR
jgi:hypothetical protein